MEMSIVFRAEQEYLTFHDPMQGGALIDRKTEIRFDPLTGETSRILHDPGAPFIPPDYSEADALTGGKKCPFCPENVYTSTPSFPEPLVPGGRLARGEAVAFPNLFPYSKHNAVVRMCDRHYVRLEQFTAPMIANAFSVAHAYLGRVLQDDPHVKHISLNWNYLPPSGGSILHPHVHVLASEHPTRYHRLVGEEGRRFCETQGKSYYAALIEQERKTGERWVGQSGSLAWTHAFAPKGHNDFIGVFEHARSFRDLDDRCWEELADSLIRLFGYFQSVGLASFNMAALIPLEAEEANRVHVRLVPRLTLGQLGTSDLSVFNFLHGESLCLNVPEQVARAAAVYFDDAGDGKRTGGN